MRKCVIYKIENPNGRIYIGKTFDFSKRMSAYRRTCKNTKNQRLLYNSLVKYSFNNHVVTILNSGVYSLDEANSLEKFWIANYMSNAKKHPEKRGMNLTDGGDGLLGYVPTEETRIKLRKMNFGRKASPESIERMRIAQKGRVVSAEARRKLSIAGKGRKFSKETLKILSDKKIGVLKSEETKMNMTVAQTKLRGKAVLVFNKRGEFITKYASIGETARRIGGGQSSVSECLLGNASKYRGYTFKYAS